MNKQKLLITPLLAALILLSGCQREVTPTGDFIARSTIPQPLWMPDKLVDYLAAMPYDKESDDYIIKLAVQQEQLDALHTR